ncbi:hypothetical protein [Corynebacterium belfantii]|uniref:hypothetical protein n=1 Tax=Corynebacterium belfantii TaxID=2014537 RepID=UPI0018D47D3F|nr:hypothetical protein [Corynebacterium belfantii]MBG9319433.1 hypothetical protein [Corynebacterium belfantii]
MNVTQANSVISALNHVAELVTALAADVESAAWEGIEDHAGMSGVRPIAAAQLAQPALADAVGEHDKQVAQARAQQTSSPFVDPAPVISLEEVRGVLAQLSSSGKTAQVRQLILDAGAERLSDVDPAKYGWLLEQAKGLV